MKKEIELFPEIGGKDCKYICQSIQKSV